MKRYQILRFAVLCVFLIGSDGFTSIPLTPGMMDGWSIVKPWMPQVQQAARFAVSAMGPWNSLIYVYHARQAVCYLKLSSDI